MCWKPQLGRLRPLAHLYRGGCKAIPPAADTTNWAAKPVPPSGNSLFGSADSQAPNVVSPLDLMAGREGQPSDFPFIQVGREEPQSHVSAEPVPPPTTGASPGLGVAFLEGQVAAMQLEVQTIRQEMQSLITAVNMANEETQKVTSRMD